MKKLVVAAIVLLAAVGQVSVAGAQTTPPPSSINPNSLPLPWWFRKNNMPGMAWFYQPPAPPRPKQCRVAYWYQAQFWNTDEWGHTVTWTGYAPQYVCD
jgi:hypothetical protein